MNIYEKRIPTSGTVAIKTNIIKKRLVGKL